MLLKHLIDLVITEENVSYHLTIRLLLNMYLNQKFNGSKSKLLDVYKKH